MATRKSLVLVTGLFQELNTSSDKLDFGGNTTADLSENTNLFYTDARSRAAISIVDSGGEGSLAYNNSSGVLTYTGPSDSDIRGKISGAGSSGLTYNSSTGVLGTSSIPNAQLANSSVTIGSTAVALGATVTTFAGISSLTATSVIGTTLYSGAIDAANTISISSGNITFEGSTANAYEVSLTSADATADRTVTLPDATGTIALLSTISAANSGTGYGSLAYSNGAFTFTKVTDANIRERISVTDSGGDGALAYNNSTGVLTYTGPSAAEVRAHISVASGSGLTYSSGEIGTSSIPNSQLANSAVTVGSTAITLGSSATTLTGISSITSNAVVTDDSGFRIRDNSDNTKQLAFECSGISSSSTRTLTVPDESGTIASEAYATAIAVALG